MILLGIDYGEKRVGLALSNNSAATPLTALDNTNETYTIKEIILFHCGIAII